jgi:sugar phosphate isomerase/epimerase
MGRKLSLEPLGVLDATDCTLVNVAAEAGFEYVSMFAYSTAPQLPTDPAVADRSLRKAVAERLSQTGVKLLNLECFNLTPEEDPANFTDALEFGAELGASRATAIIYDNADRRDALSKFRRLCDMAREHDIAINLEFFATCRTIPNLDAAVDFVREAACANSGIVVDFLHLVRTSGGMAGLVDVDPDMIGMVQVSDGLLDSEGIDLHADMLERGLPGSGEFPLREFFAWLDPAVVIGVEVPQLGLMGKVPAIERAKNMAQATRALL